MLKQMRGQHGGPSAGMRLLAVVMALLLGAPLTLFLWDVGARVLSTLL